ncbi:hypothetical protein [Robertkochia sediminum]|uniref:hypothetical protein n=1 Tax=Robertkochia sediminum TaxID=2785326 RepID=UPI001934299C|nr:hypothetical protein [Robertkochia sediminum]MBL7471263.1 hypothetical protein [Robertkochia sediminum]
MKNILNLILTAVAAWAICLITPWWGIMIAALAISFLIPLKKGAAFLIPFLAVFLLWGIQAYLLSSGNDLTMAKKIATLFSLNENAYLLMGITALIGGLAAAFSGLLGKQLRTAFTA